VLDQRKSPATTAMTAYVQGLPPDHRR